jgi:hypothetical protein
VAWIESRRDRVKKDKSLSASKQRVSRPASAGTRSPERPGARLLEFENGSRPEEVAVADASLEQAKADLENTRINLERTRKLAAENVMSKQALDNAQATYDAQAARVRSLERTFELVRIGPRREQIAAVRGQIEEVKGEVAFFQTQLSNASSEHQPTDHPRRKSKSAGTSPPASSASAAPKATWFRCWPQ